MPSEEEVRLIPFAEPIKLSAKFRSNVKPCLQQRVTKKQCDDPKIPVFIRKRFSPLQTVFYLLIVETEAFYHDWFDSISREVFLTNIRTRGCSPADLIPPEMDAKK